MPELPDLEVFKTNVFNRITSKRLIGLEVFHPQKVMAAKSMLLNDLVGKELLSINRIGKELFFGFDDGKIIAAHLMLNGEISVVATKEAVDAIRFKIFAMMFENETIVFSDRGSLCTIKYMPLVSKTPDAFDDLFTLAYFLNTAHQKSRTNVKSFLIDQKIVKGIGNAYADEILWSARISPHSIVGKIPDDQLEVLYLAIGSVLKNAIDEIKKISPDAISGEERSFLKVHNRARKKTETGATVIVDKIASKITYYTQEQVLYS